MYPPPICDDCGKENVDFEVEITLKDYKKKATYTDEEGRERVQYPLKVPFSWQFHRESCLKMGSFEPKMGSFYKISGLFSKNPALFGKIWELSISRFAKQVEEEGIFIEEVGVYQHENR